MTSGPGNLPGPLIFYALMLVPETSSRCRIFVDA